VPNPDIVAEAAELPDDRRPFIVGFAAETHDIEANAKGKLRDKGLDLIVANRVGGDDDAIGADRNEVTVFAIEGELVSWPSMPKRQVAERLWDLIADRLQSRSRSPAASSHGG
jgi:phosphopantothenoylcysteine decarboxylase/phosphopantothenate--cysteine ligase